MAGKKKYNPDDVERWVTVRGARIPIMKDGSFGVGEKEEKALKRESAALKKAKELSEQGEWGRDNSHPGAPKYTYAEQQAMKNFGENRFKNKEDALDAYKKGDMSASDYYKDDKDYQTKEAIRKLQKEYEYISNVNGYQVYRKIENGKGVWAAHDQEGKNPPFPISYEQARGYEPIITNPTEKLRSDLGKMLLPPAGYDGSVQKTTSRNERYDTSRANKPTSSRHAKIRNILGDNQKDVEWRLGKAYDRTSLMEVAEEAGVSSAKLRKMDTASIREMLLAMWNGK